MNLTTRELLYLEDLAKLFESINKNCSRGMQSTSDQQVKTVLQQLSQDHQQWLQTSASLIQNNGQTLH
jgi:hypothetical protein